MPRFRHVVLLLFLPFVVLASQPDLSYRLTPVSVDGRLVVDVRMSFLTGGRDSTRLELPDRYGGQEQYDGIVDLRCDDPAVRLVPTSDRATWWAVHQGAARVDLDYRLRELREGSVELGDHYQAVVRPGLVHALGNSLFIVPCTDDSLDIDVAWTDTPRDWRFASSFGLGVGPLRTRQTPAWFLHSVWLAGDVRMRETVVGGRTVAVAIAGRWSFDDNDLLRLVRTILQVERDFFDDYDTPFFLVTALEIGGDNDQGGTGRVNSFALFLSDDRRVDLRLKRLLAHEIFHAWNGDRTEREAPEALTYWFTEGFADYYARRFLLLAGLITPQEYLDDLNAILRDYFSSSMRTLPNEALVDGPSGDRDIQRLPYRRGDILAHHLAAAAAGHGRSLDSAVRNYLLEAMRRPHAISNRSLIDTLSGLLPAADQPLMRAWVEGTIPLDPERPAFTRGAVLSLLERRRYLIVGERLVIPSYRPADGAIGVPLEP